jgi:Flp pilus assembly secretin CpaC
MRHFILALVAFGAAAVAAQAEGVSVAADQVERIHLRGSAADVVIGNPDVADVAMIDSRTLVITGKAPGTTSLVVFDSARRVLFDGPVSVGVRAGHVAMVRGAEGGAAEEKLFTCYGVCTARAAR